MVPQWGAVKKATFVEKVLDLWVTTAIPLTQANVQIHTKASRKKIKVYLDEMLNDGILDIDSDHRGNLIYTVPGAQRASGPKTFSEKKARKDLTGSIGNALAKKSRPSMQPRSGEKSPVASGLLSMVFGPLGWFYAGSYKEAAIGSAAFLAAGAILPSFLFGLIAVPAMVASGAAGALYALQHNRHGKRKALISSDE